MAKSHKIHFYDYLDIIDSSNKTEELERKGKKEDKYSWSILVEDLKEKVIENGFINDFIKKIYKNIKFSDIYYNTINKHIDEIMDKINDENSELLYLLQKNMFLYYLDDINFYLLQKKKIVQEITIINKLYIKLKTTFDIRKRNIINNILNINLERFKKRKNVLRLVIKKNNLYYYDDDIIINLNNDDLRTDIKKYINFIEYKNMVYSNVKIPKYINIKETNNFPVFNYNIFSKGLEMFYISIIVKNYKYRFIPIINDFIIKCNYNNYFLDFKFHREYLYLYTYTYYFGKNKKIIYYLFIINDKEFRWIIYKFYKIS